MADKITIKMEIQNQSVVESLKRVISSIDGFQVDNPGQAGSCDLLILEIGSSLKEEFQKLHEIQASGKVGGIFLTSAHLEPDVLIQALRAGVKEFFSQPIKPEEVSNALLKFKATRPRISGSSAKTKRGEIIQVIGSKGGVGVTTLAVNLAIGLTEADKSQSVALMDMNLLFGEIPIFLDIKSAFDWGEVVKNVSRVDATLLKGILFKHSSGVLVLPSPTGLDGVNHATPEILEKLLTVMRETFSYTIIDGGQSIVDDFSLKILEMADHVLLATSLSLPCLTNMKRILWTFQRLGYPSKNKIKIVANRFQKDSLISHKDAEASIAHPIFWQIPNDFQTTMAAINQGKSLFQLEKGGEICKSFRKLAESFLPKTHRTERDKGGFWNKVIRSEKESRRWQ